MGDAHQPDGSGETLLTGNPGQDQQGQGVGGQAAAGQVPGQTGGQTPPASNDFPAWMAQNPEGLKTNESLKQFKTVGDLSKAFLEADQKITAIQSPPESPEKYELRDLTFPDGLERDEEFIKAFRERSHLLKLTNQQANNLYEWYGEIVINQFKDARDNRQREKNAVIQKQKEEWGDKYEGNLERAQRVIAKYATKEEIDHLRETGKGNDPILINIIHRIGEDIAEDTLLSGIPGKGEKQKGFYYPSMNK